MMEDITKDIIARAAHADMSAFEEIYKKTSVFVYNVALRITNNSQDAAEVTQDVFMKIYRNLGRFNFLSSFKTWIYRITVNAAINYKKSAARHVKQRVDYESAVKSVVIRKTARDKIDREYRKERVSVLLSELNPEQRACIALREIEGLDYGEIADVLKININTVRSRLKRAREKLLAFAKKG